MGFFSKLIRAVKKPFKAAAKVVRNIGRSIRQTVAPSAPSTPSAFAKFAVAFAKDEVQTVRKKAKERRRSRGRAATILTSATGVGPDGEDTIRKLGS